MEFPLGVFLFLGGTESGCPFFKKNQRRVNDKIIEPRIHYLQSRNAGTIYDHAAFTSAHKIERDAFTAVNKIVIASVGYRHTS